MTRRTLLRSVVPAAITAAAVGKAAVQPRPKSGVSVGCAGRLFFKNGEAWVEIGEVRNVAIDWKPLTPNAGDIVIKWPEQNLVFGL